MLFAHGSRVRFIHTGLEGEVIETLSEDMVTVLLDDGDEIPGFVDDLERVENEKPSVKAQIVAGKQPKVIKKPDAPKIAAQYSILKSLGIQLAFDPVHRPDGSTSHYQIYLINDTPYDVLLSFELSVLDAVTIRKNDKLASVTAIQTGQLLFDQLNDSPKVKVDIWQITTAGTGSKHSKTLRIKAQQFFKKIRTAPILNKQVHHYKLFENFDQANSNKEEDLKSYTQRKAVPTRRRQDGDYRHLSKNEIAEYANFEPELDLHIQKLRPDAKGMNNADILRLQISHFDEFMRRAMRLGVPRVFIIHGVGKGRLRDSIASRLIRMPEVETFRNEYHPRYGYGATEVILREAEG